MLEQDDAERLLGLCQAQIESYANPETPVDGEDLELLAESLSGLGFFVEALEQQRPDRERLIAPLLAKRLGEAPAAQDDRAAKRSRTRSRNCATAAQARRGDPPCAGRCRGPRRIDGETQGSRRRCQAHRRHRARRPGAGGAAELSAGGGSTAAAPWRSRPRSPRSRRAARRWRRPLQRCRLRRSGCSRPTPTASTPSSSRSTSSRPPRCSTRSSRIAPSSSGTPAIARRCASARRQFHTIKGSGRMVGLTSSGSSPTTSRRSTTACSRKSIAVTPAMLALIGSRGAEFPATGSGRSGQRRRLADPAELYAAIGRRRSGAAVRIRIRRRCRLRRSRSDRAGSTNARAAGRRRAVTRRRARSRDRRRMPVDECPSSRSASRC